jgi:phosphotransferase system  glucose/maltose/N-acetylglucosamine-specific IIC component
MFIKKLLDMNILKFLYYFACCGFFTFVLFFWFSGCDSDDFFGDYYEISWLSWFFIILISFGLAFLMLKMDMDEKKYEKEEAEKREKQKKEQEEALMIKEQEYKSLREEFFRDNGGISDKCIATNQFDLLSEIHIYESSKTVFILGKKYKFKDIISCTFSDNKTIKHGEMTAVSTTKSSNGNAIGRAVVGGVIAGGAGAVIGGTTGKKNTETIYKQKDDIVKHDYTVIINVNSISNPIVRINLGDNGKLVNEIVATMNVIIMNK